MRGKYQVGTYRVLRVRHGVEGAKRHRELVNNEIVRVVLLLDDPAQAFFIFRAVQNN
jgi:hypothetical protein